MRKEINAEKNEWVQNFVFLQVNYRKLLEMDPFFLSHINLGVGKLQDIGNKICQTIGDDLRMVKHLEWPFPHFFSAKQVTPTVVYCRS